MINLKQVKQWFRNAVDSDELYDSDLEYATEGVRLEFESIPEDYSVAVVAVNTERDYNSYGDRSLENGYIVFSVTDSSGVSETFKLPVEYSSYAGWDFQISNITKTVKRSRMITTYEWANVES